MSMQESVLYIVLTLLCFVIYLLINQRKNKDDAIGVTDNFGRDARSIMRTLENIKDPEEVEKVIKEDIDKVKVLNK